MNLIFSQEMSCSLYTSTKNESRIFTYISTICAGRLDCPMFLFGQVYAVSKICPLPPERNRANQSSKTKQVLASSYSPAALIHRSSDCVNLFIVKACGAHLLKAYEIEELVEISWRKYICTKINLALSETILTHYA